MLRFIKLSLVICMLAVCAFAENERESVQVKPIPTQTYQEQVRQSMQVKTDLSKEILPALVMRDFGTIESTAKKLKNVSLQAPKRIEGDDTENDLYKHFRLEFLRLTTQLEQMAAAENLEGTAYAYQNLTANCLACHGFLNHADEK